MGKGIHRIDSYSFGRIVIDGRTYTSDVIILPDSVIGNWWRKSGHSLATDDLGDVFRHSPELLIVGQGASGIMDVPESTRKAIESKGIKVIAQPTDRAVQTYNEAAERGENVAAALHLTC
ncbi:MAG: Mth938-like domain-containing protein [bacterium]